MNISIKRPLCLFALASIFLAGTALTAPIFNAPYVPSGSNNSYTLGPFEAYGVGMNSTSARQDAMGNMWDQIYGPGGIESQLPPDHVIAFIDIISEEYEQPEYTIIFTVTIDNTTSTGTQPGGSL
jgi:hypothetical protein